jgi:hypothetical protein
MTFTVTYRGADGAMCEEAVEAADRAECVAECRRRGIAPASIREGGRVGKRRDAVSSRQKPFTIHSYLFVAIAALAAIALWWWFASRGARDEARPPQAVKTAVERPAKPKVEKQQPPSKPKAKPAVTNAPAAKPAPAPATNAPPPFVKRPGALQLPDGKVLTFPAPKEGEIRKVYAYGHMYECDHEGNFRDVTKRQLFSTAFEANFLGLAVEDKPFIPAFLKGLDQDEVKKMLLKPYDAKGDETEEEMAQLKSYHEMRLAALQYMEEGGSFDEFVDYFAKQVKEERETNALCLREVMTLYKQGKLDEAKEMAEAANALKKQKGLNELKLPAHVRERLGL